MLLRAAKATRLWAGNGTLTPRLLRACSQAKAVLDVSPHLQPSTSTETPIAATPNDTSLVYLFDRPHSTSWIAAHAPTGLFSHQTLTSPTALRNLAEGTLRRARGLTNRILQAEWSKNELLMVVKNLDKLSDLLCGVIDLAELIRNTHPNSAWVKSADEAYDKLCEFMNELNTNVDLYRTLEIVFSDPSIVNSLSREALQTALIFKRDFEKSAINLPSPDRQRFVSLSSEILVLARQFLNEAATVRPPASISSTELQGLKDKGMGARLHLQAQFTNRDLLVYPGSLQAQMIMRSAPFEEPRRKMYVAANSSTPEQVETLEKLLRARAELAMLVGKTSYAHMTLDDKMAKSPENVRQFLDTLMNHTKPHARRALRTLSQRKQAHMNLSAPPIIQAWDRDYYCPPETPAPPLPLPHLTPGTVFMALSRLFSRLYGITFRPVEVAAGETWHSDVRKLEVVDEDAGVIGWIYADIFTRRGKASGAAHYTVRCSRRTDDDDENVDLQYLSEIDDTVQQSLAFSRAHRTRFRGREGEHQLPVVVLLCDFSSPTRSGPIALDWSEVQTLFHEMGHAMHSMIGRTEYQNVSGTRCATDFVELPSILMEHFLNSSAVLSLFNLEGGSVNMRAGNHHVDPCHSIDTHTQILLAYIDQIYHSPMALDPAFNSTELLSNLHDTVGLIPSVPGTSWQTQFGHLYGYGATYYSYLFDRAIASRVWTQVFASNPLDRDMGEKYKQEVLRYGGGKDPWSMLSTLLSAPELDRGDTEAMREVGRWKIEEEVAVPSRH
ncbi:mitochondrial intermediate peptidase [Rickenella mellea]|uniref:Mitochondrial intermediate peptidase n=1 Tax=Rickenella mellea TaxID=50990 RepID=A0A4Y7QML4_9AGAM|nr:mitochondrial intermediate peptidase [Rickenella mellea]